MLTPIPLNIPRLTLPPDAEALVVDAEQRIADFAAAHQQDALASFVPSDFRRAWQALDAVRSANLPAGDAFCEWGSGFGVVTMLAAMCDFDATGIEFEADLVDEAEQLADDYDLAVEFACGSFVPASLQAVADQLDESHIMSCGGADGYDLLGLDPDDFDVVYAFPWPGEQGLIEALFDRSTAIGALLMTYNGLEDVKLMRKTD